MDATDKELKEEIKEPTNESNSSKKNRLSGAARKRLRALLLNNVDKEEAYKLCKLSYKMMTEKVPDLPKNLESEGVSQKDIYHTESSSSHEEDYLQVGIKNKKPMTKQELNLVRQALLASIIECPDGQGPKFTDCSHKAGWLLITCDDEKSMLWLEQQVPIIKPWHEAELSVIHRSKFPQPTIGKVIIPSSETDEPSVAIALMRSQNNGLNTELWKIESKVDERGLTLTVVLDDDSAEAIRNMNCRVHLGLSKVLFKLSDGEDPYKSNRPGAQGESTSVQLPTGSCSAFSATCEGRNLSSGERSDSHTVTTASDRRRLGWNERGVYKLYKISPESWNRTKESRGDRQRLRKPWRDSPEM